jgi:hypothetical protein
VREDRQVEHAGGTVERGDSSSPGSSGTAWSTFAGSGAVSMPTLSASRFDGVVGGEPRLGAHQVEPVLEGAAALSA